MTRPRLSLFARKLLHEWQRLELPETDARIIVAVSGGADSAALMLGLDELVKNEKLQFTLTIAHLDHGLRVESRKDAVWVSQLAKELGHAAVAGKANLKRKTSKPRENLEQAARKARYEFLQKTAAKADSQIVLTAHTLDDQAETILLRLLRGSAAEGLSGIPTEREIARGSQVKLVRPLLSWAQRRDTEDYCRLRQIDFRVDEMNDDESFARVRVRKQLLPLMKSFNSRTVEALSRTAVLLNEDAAALQYEAVRLLEAAIQPSRTPIVREGSIRRQTSALANARGSARTATRRSPIVREGAIGRQNRALANARGSAWLGRSSETKWPSLSVSVLLQAPVAVRRRALREWILRARGNLYRVEMVHLVNVEALLKGERGGRVAELPGGMTVTRRRGMLELCNKKG